MKSLRLKKKFLLLLTSLLCTFAGALEIYRPENFGAMNDVPCMLSVTDEDGNDASDKIISISFSWYYEMQWLHRHYNGCMTGGTVIHLHMKSGVYHITVHTPPESQNNLVPDNRNEWTSNTFVFNTENQPHVIFVSPTANQNGFYTGGWHIDYRAPKFYKYTKPYRE